METDLRQRILETGRTNFFSRGLSKVTMDDLAGQLGISKKTMYKHFPSKDGLANAILDWQIAEVGSRVSEIVSSGDDYLQRLYAVWTYLAKVYSQISTRCQEDLRRIRPDIWKRVESFREESIRTHFSDLIDEGVRLGIIRSDLRKDLLVMIYLSAVQGIINPEVLMQNSFSASEAYHTIIQVYLRGILADNSGGVQSSQGAFPHLAEGIV